jgi:4-oxalmesaconate hydratase
MGKPPLDELVAGNVWFDTCVYHQAGIDCLLAVVPADNILFGSEMVGAVRGIDPETGHHFDDTRRYLEAAGLDADTGAKIYEANARRVYPRLAAPAPDPGGQVTAGAPPRADGESG